MSGKDAEPLLVSLKEGYKPNQGKSELRVTRKANILDRKISGGSSSGGGGGGSDSSGNQTLHSVTVSGINVVSYNLYKS